MCQDDADTLWGSRHIFTMTDAAPLEAGIVRAHAYFTRLRKLRIKPSFKQTPLLVAHALPFTGSQDERPNQGIGKMVGIAGECIEDWCYRINQSTLRG